MSDYRKYRLPNPDIRTQVADELVGSSIMENGPRHVGHDTETRLVKFSSLKGRGYTHETPPWPG